MINGMDTNPLRILYFTPSLETQEPKKRFNAKKCNQNINKKLSIANELILRMPFCRFGSVGQF